jgi:branched-chain amino acid transport system ATP-binding protein
MTNPVLAIKSLTAGYRPGEAVVRDIAITVDAVEIVGILGPNGAGKSTVLRALAGACPYVLGEASLGGWDILALPVRDRVRRGLGFVPRDGATFPNLTVRENLMVGAFTAASGAVVSARIEEVLAYLPLLEPLLRRPVGNLSGGQAELVAIGIGLMSAPTLLMIDEPSAGLSGSAVTLVMESIGVLAKRRRLPILLVEQNLGVARGLCSRFYVLESGGAMVGEAANFTEANLLLESTIEGSYRAARS